jgi:hypothetical protein
VATRWSSAATGASPGWGEGPECYAAKFPDHPSATETRAIATAYLDAYNGHLIGRSLQMLAETVVYRDCGNRQGRHVTITGSSQVKAWLRSRFADRDHLAKAGSIHATADTAALIVIRNSHSFVWVRSQTMTVRVDRYGSALREVSFSGAGCG